MKMWKIILIVLVVIILGDLLLTFLLVHKSTAPTPQQTNGFATTTQNTSMSPVVFATNFYSWYLSKRAADVTFPASTDLNVSLSPWLTQNFINNWDIIGNKSDADPALFAQDTPQSWNTVPPQGSMVTLTDNVSTVTVILGANTPQSHPYTVSLVKVNGQWRIDSIQSTY